MRVAKVERKTAETTITVDVNLDGGGKTALGTGVPFLDHMLDQVGRHSLIDLDVEAGRDYKNGLLARTVPYNRSC